MPLCKFPVEIKMQVYASSIGHIKIEELLPSCFPLRCLGIVLKRNIRLLPLTRPVNDRSILSASGPVSDPPPDLKPGSQPKITSMEVFSR